MRVILLAVYSDEMLLCSTCLGLCFFLQYSCDDQIDTLLSEGVL